VGSPTASVADQAAANVIDTGLGTEYLYKLGDIQLRHTPALSAQPVQLKIIGEFFQFLC